MFVHIPTIPSSPHSHRPRSGTSHFPASKVSHKALACLDVKPRASLAPVPCTRSGPLHRGPGPVRGLGLGEQLLPVELADAFQDTLHQEEQVLPHEGVSQWM